MTASGLSTRTVDARRRAVEALERFAGQSADRVDADTIEGWFGRHEEWSAATRATYFGAVQAYMRWAVQRGVRSDDPTLLLRRPKHPQGVPKPISGAQLRRLLDAPARRKTHAYVVLAAFQGLRVHEIAKLRGEDFDLDDGWLYVEGKGGREDRLPLHPQTEALAREMPRRGFWFPSRSASGHVTATGVSNVVTAHMQRCGVRGTAHQLRHWYATQLVRDGVHVRVVQQLMRHRSLATTARYAAVADDQLFAAARGVSA